MGKINDKYLLHFQCKINIDVQKWAFAAKKLTFLGFKGLECTVIIHI